MLPVVSYGLAHCPPPALEPLDPPTCVSLLPSTRPPHCTSNSSSQPPRHIARSMRRSSPGPHSPRSTMEGEMSLYLRTGSEGHSEAGQLIAAPASEAGQMIAATETGKLICEVAWQ